MVEEGWRLKISLLTVLKYVGRVGSIKAQGVAHHPQALAEIVCIVYCVNVRNDINM